MARQAAEEAARQVQRTRTGSSEVTLLEIYAQVPPGVLAASCETLVALETDVEREVCALSPWINRLDHIDPRAGRVVANFSIDRARAQTRRNTSAGCATARRTSVSNRSTLKADGDTGVTAAVNRKFRTR